MSGAELHLLRPLWLLLLLPAAWLAWRLATRRGSPGAWRDVVDPALLRHLLVETDGRRRRLPYLLLGLAWLLLVVAIAGPTWRQLPQPVYQSPVYRVVVLDVSLSMNATDVTPSRLAQARFRTIDLVEQVEDGQVALIAYGGEPYIVSPLTGDGATISAQVPLLGTELLPTTGPPRADLALDLARDLLAQAGAVRADVILLTDGIREPDRVEAAAFALREAGHRLSILAFGTIDGGPIPMPGGGFARNARGEVIVQGVDLAGMSPVARAGGGDALRATASASELTRLRPREPGVGAAGAQDGGVAADRWYEEGPWLLLLLLPLAALAFRRGWIAPPVLLLPVLLLPPADGYALTWDELWLRDDQRAYRALQEGRTNEAVDLFSDPDWRAAAAYRDGNFAGTLDSLGSEDDATTAYNRGNALARLGRLEDAVAAYDAALARNPDDIDARFNRDLVQDLLDRQAEDAGDETGDETQPDTEPGDEEPSGDGDSGQDGDASRGDEQAAESDDGERGEAGDSQRDGEEGGAEGNEAGEGETPPDEAAGDNAESEDPAGGEGEDTPSADGGSDGEPPGSTADDEVGQQGTGETDAGPQEGAGGQREADRDGGTAPTGEDLVTDGGDAPEERGAAGDEGLGDQPMPGAEDLIGDRPGPTGQGPETTPGPGGAQPAGDESSQAIDQMLRRVEDDPGGLLRQRFLLQHLRRHGQLPE